MFDLVFYFIFYDLYTVNSTVPGQ